MIGALKLDPVWMIVGNSPLAIKKLDVGKDQFATEKFNVFRDQSVTKKLNALRDQFVTEKFNASKDLIMFVKNNIIVRDHIMNAMNGVKDQDVSGRKMTGAVMMKKFTISEEQEQQEKI